MSFLKLWQLIQAIIAFVHKYGSTARPIIEKALSALLAAGTITQSQYDNLESLLDLLLGPAAAGMRFAVMHTSGEAEFREMAGL